MRISFNIKSTVSVGVELDKTLNGTDKIDDGIQLFNMKTEEKSDMSKYICVPIDNML